MYHPIAEKYFSEIMEIKDNKKDQHLSGAGLIY